MVEHTVNQVRTNEKQRDMKGICFKEELFKKTIEGTKTQTRRLAKEGDNLNVVNGKPTYLVKPKFNVGETIYLKEPWVQEAKIDDSIEGFTGLIATGKYLYKYSGDNLSTNDTKSPFGKWKNKLFMPASDARYFIKITGVIAERLQDISSEDCIKEGIFKHISHAKIYWKNGFDNLMYEKPEQAYEALINLINGKGTWHNNPFVWVYDYVLTTNHKPERP